MQIYQFQYGCWKLVKMLISALHSNRHLLTNEIHKQTGAVVFQETEFAVFLLDFNLTRFFQHAHNWTLRIPVLQTLRQWFSSCVGTLHILSLLLLFYSPRPPRWLWEQTLLKMHLPKTKSHTAENGSRFLSGAGPISGAHVCWNHQSLIISLFYGIFAAGVVVV